MMSRKHYIAIADIFNYHSNTAYPNASELMKALLVDVVDILKHDNRRFDKDRFLTRVYEVSHECRRPDTAMVKHFPILAVSNVTSERKERLAPRT